MLEHPKSKTTEHILCQNVISLRQTIVLNKYILFHQIFPIASLDRFKLGSDIIWILWPRKHNSAKIKQTEQWSVIGQLVVKCFTIGTRCDDWIFHPCLNISHSWFPATNNKNIYEFNHHSAFNVPCQQSIFNLFRAHSNKIIAVLGPLSATEYSVTKKELKYLHAPNRWNLKREVSLYSVRMQ